MSKTKPMTKMKKFIKLKPEIVKQLIEHQRICYNDNVFTNFRPHKHSLIYIGANMGVNNLTFCLEIEYEDVLMIFYYNPSDIPEIEYSFAFEWTSDEIYRGTDIVKIHPDIDEGGLFQISLLNDIQFLTVELHTELVKFCRDIEKDLRNALEKI